MTEDHRLSKIVAIARGQFSGRRSSLVEDRRYRSRTILGSRIIACRRSSLPLGDKFYGRGSSLVEDRRYRSRTIFWSKIIACRRSSPSLENSFLVEVHHLSKIVAIAREQFSGRRQSLVEDRHYRSRTIYRRRSPLVEDRRYRSRTNFLVEDHRLSKIVAIARGQF